MMRISFQIPKIFGANVEKFDCALGPISNSILLVDTVLLCLAIITIKDRRVYKF